MDPSFTFILHVHPQANCCSETFFWKFSKRTLFKTLRHLQSFLVAFNEQVQNIEKFKILFVEYRKSKNMLWHLRNDENRPSLTCSAVADERQDVSSKNMVDEMADAITGGNGVGLWVLWPANRFFLTLRRKVIFKTLCSTTQKRQKLVTEMYHKSYSSPEPQWRSGWQKLTLFFSFTNLCQMSHL